MTGNWAIRATNGNGAEQLVIKLEPNATYRLTGWGKVEGTEPMLVGVKPWRKPEGHPVHHRGIRGGNHDLQHRVFQYVSGDSAYKQQVENRAMQTTSCSSWKA